MKIASPKPTLGNKLKGFMEIASPQPTLGTKLKGFMEIASPQPTLGNKLRRIYGNSLTSANAREQTVLAQGSVQPTTKMHIFQIK